MRRYARLGWILLVVLLPLELAGLCALAIYAYGLVRYDPAFFAESYTAQYDTPGAVAKALESALQTSDPSLLAELQGLRLSLIHISEPTRLQV